MGCSRASPWRVALFESAISSKSAPPRQPSTKIPTTIHVRAKEFVVALKICGIAVAVGLRTYSFILKLRKRKDMGCVEEDEGIRLRSGLTQTKQILCRIVFVFPSTARVVSEKKCAFMRKWPIKARFSSAGGPEHPTRRRDWFDRMVRSGGQAAASGSGQSMTMPDSEKAA